jgi:hypothetical protein
MAAITPLKGLCRWCARPRVRELGNGSDLCCACEGEGEIAISFGSFEAAQSTLQWWRTVNSTFR